jgi:hypothetical protein
MSKKDKTCKVSENKKIEKNDKKKYHKLSVLLNYFIKLFSKWYLKLNKNEKLNNELGIEDLTANLSNDDEKEFIKPYLNSLKYSISNENVTNIALTGGFGTGKSTIINEFIKQYKGYEYLQISLANFKENENDEKLIETSILQQIIYFERKDKIKESSFSRIDFTNNKLKLIYSLLILLWIYSIIYLFFETINSKICFLGNAVENFFQIFFVFGIVVLIYKTFDKLKNFKLSKLSPNDLEVVNDKDENQLSVFNRNIEEIIYFFEKTDTNVVIIEDIDRFRNDVAIQLFSKIRELSILIKQSKDVKQKVSFIYAVKDELLLKEKTKFFDIIIPVIPITDYNNSKNIFIKKLAKFLKAKKTNSNDVINNLEIKEEKKSLESEENLVISIEKDVEENYLDESFISEVSNYVFDMRTVINICNEFKIYENVLKSNKSSLNKNKLFGIILYKNLFPEDFAKIQKGNSNLHSIFKRNISEDSLFGKKIMELQNDKAKNETDKEKLKDNLDDNILKDITELRKIYLFELLKELTIKGNKITNIENIEITGDFTKDENFNILKNSQNIVYNIGSFSKSNSYISFNDIEKKVSKQNYMQREQLINDFHNNKINKIQEKINDSNYLIGYINNGSVADLYKEFEVEMHELINLAFNTKQVDLKTKKEIEIVSTNIELIHYLIKNDYINEDFVNYVSYFHEGSLSRNDHNLLMKIVENKPTEFDTNIDNVEKLVNEINSIRYSNKSVLIFEIFRFLLKDSQKPYLKNTKLDLLLNQVTNYNDDSIVFIEKFIKTLKSSNEENINILSNFYVEITKTWDGFWVVVKNNFSNEFLKREILFDLFQLFSDNSGNQIINTLNRNKSITDYINSDDDFLKDIFERISIGNFISTLKILDFKLKGLSYDSKLDDLLLEIYKNNLYEINPNNLMLFAKIDTKYNFDEKLFLDSNYSFLKTKEDTFLFNRISSNLNEYIEKGYIKIDENVKEKPETIEQLLEFDNDKIIINNKIKIIEKGFDGKLENIDKISEYEVASFLLTENKVTSNWENLIEFSKRENFKVIDLINFLNFKENYSTLSIQEMYEEYETLFDSKDSCLEFIYNIINNDELSNESLESIFETVDNIKLETSKIKIINRIPHLLENEYFKLNKLEFDYLYNSNKDILIKLIEKNEEEFINNINDYYYEIDFIEKILKSNISHDNKNSAIIHMEDEVASDKNLSVLNKIAEFYIDNTLYEISNNLFEILVSSNINENYKICLFNNRFKEDLKSYDVSGHLELMGNKFEDILNEKDVSFELNDDNVDFLKILKENEIIYSFKRDNKKGVINIKYN